MLRFDVAIVGAGSAGAVLAARLSEDAGLSVVLLEAGGVPRDPDIAVPQKWPFIQGRDYDWAFATVPQAGTAGRVHAWPRGRILGGSSCLHAMAHMRGHAQDFAPWAAAAGDSRWSFEGLLPAFVKSESFDGPPSSLRGTAGPLPVHLPDEAVNPVVRAYMAAGRSLGIPAITDHNSGPMNGTCPNSLTIRDGRRVSAADAYLTPQVRRRPNLTVLTDAPVRRLRLSNGRVDGIEATVEGAARLVEADRYILSAGAVSTPLLLMRSGIGPAAVLRLAGVDCVLDRAQVGENLQDHLLAAGNLYRARRPVPPSRLQLSESMMYLDAGDPAAADGAPDVVIGCVTVPSLSDALAAQAGEGPGYTLLCGVTHPTSRGRLAITGPEPADAPLIDPAYLSTEHDRRLFRRALRLAREIGRAAPLDDWRAAEILPGPAIDDGDDAALDDFIARAAITHHHPCGTCRMGADDDAVVDAALRVKGLANLHVVDASVMPTITSGPIHAAVLAVAETFAAGFS